jgi:hypothetical protein
MKNLQSKIKRSPLGRQIFLQVLLSSFIGSSWATGVQQASCSAGVFENDDQRRACLSELSQKYQRAEVKANLELAYKIIVDEIEPLINAEGSKMIRTEEFLMNLSRIKQSLSDRIQKQKDAAKH